MNNSPNFNSNDKLENIIKSLTEQLLTKEDLKGMHYKLNQIIETLRPNLFNPEVRGGMGPFGNPAPNTGFFQPPTSPGVSPFNQRGNQMSGFFNSGNPFSEMSSNPSENPQMAMQPPAGPGVNMFKNSKSFKINPFNMDDGVSSNEAMNHPSDDVIITPIGQIIVVKSPLLQPEEQHIRYELDLTQPKFRVIHHVLTPSGDIALYHTTIDGKIIGREALPPMPQQPTMQNSVKSNPLRGAFKDPQLTPDQVKIKVLENRLESLEILLFERVIPRLDALEKLPTKKVNVSEPKIEGETDPYRDLMERLEAYLPKRRDAKTADKGEVKETVSKTDVKLDGNVCYPPKMYLENKEEIDKIHEKLKDVETIEDVRSLDLMYLVLSSLYSSYHDFTSANELLFKLRRGVGLLKILEERGLHLTYPQVFNHVANYIASRN